MIKRTIAAIDTIVSQIIEVNYQGFGAEEKAFQTGVRNISFDVKGSIDLMGELYSIFEHDGIEWVEIAVSSCPKKAAALASGYSSRSFGMVRVRYEAEDRAVFEIRKEGNVYYSHLVKGGQ